MANSKQRLVVFFDGTWNDPQDRTNVYRLSRCVHDFDGDIAQRFFYDPGVGTSRLTRFRGGVFGYGLSKNLMQGYEWLVRRYREGDEIFVFGFSRGAYTARSMVGLIRKCGLLHISTPGQLEDAEKLYRNKDAKPDGEECLSFRAQFSREVKIHFIGVWDTVGALGVPGTMISERGLFSWHDTELSKIVQRAYHAMALDEHRAAYDSVPWTSNDGKKKADQIEVEQRWFIGAHANVGGGYGDDPLCELPLRWIQEKAMAAGLKLTPCEPQTNAHMTRPKDSFKEFLAGIYSTFRGWFHRGDGRHHRAFAKDYKGVPAVNISVDPSVWQRWKAVDDYRPPTLTDAGQSPS